MQELSISQAFELFRLDEMLMKNRSPKTEESYSNACRLLVRYFGDVPVSALEASKVRDWRIHLRTWQTSDTARGNVVCLRNVLRYLSSKSYGVMNFDEIPVPKREKRLIKYLDAQEIDDFIDAAGAPARGYSMELRMRNRAIVEVFAATGLRNNELCRLDRDTIRNRSFTVIGKSKDPRIGFINERAERAIGAYIALRNDNEKALFISPQTGQRITSDTVRRVFRNTSIRSGMDGVTPRILRHSYATLMLEKEVDIIYVGDLLGHQSLDTTKIYTHYTNPKLRRIYEKAME